MKSRSVRFAFFSLTIIFASLSQMKTDNLEHGGRGAEAGREMEGRRRRKGGNESTCFFYHFVE